MFHSLILTHVFVSIKGLKSTNTLPTLTQIQLLREDDQTMEIFCNHFLACVVGKHDWKRQTKKELISQVATISDEAFALLVLENIWDEWKNMNVVEFFSRRKGMEKGTKRKKIGGGRWTSDAKGCGKYCGWNVDGMKRFSELCQQVKLNRTSFHNFDKNFLKKQMEKQSETVQNEIANSNTVIVYDDMESEVEENEV